jgi:uncharacterized protein YjdB
MLAAVSLTIAACGGGGGGDITPPPTPVVTQITLTGTGTIVAGQSTTFTALPKDASGNALNGLTVGWSISDPNVAIVSAGVVTAIKPGSATLTATSGSVSQATVITVIPAVASIAVTPTPNSLIIGQTVQLTATLLDAAGATITGRTVTWSSNNDAAASVSTTGLVTAKALGSATITAAVEGKTGTALVDVKPVTVNRVVVSPATATVTVGKTTQLTAALTDANGQPITSRPVTWTTSNASRATVDGTGLVTGVAVGSVTITATSEEGKFGTAAIDVGSAGAPTLTALTVTPPSVDVRTGAQKVTISGRATDGSGTGIGRVNVSAKGHTNSTAHGDPAISCSASGAAIVGGAWSCDLTIPAGAAGGQWVLTSVVVTDNASNATSYGEAQLSANFNAKFTVTSDEDMIEPSGPSNITVSPVNVNVTNAAADIVVAADYADNLSGVASFTYRVTSPSNPNTFVECSGALKSGVPTNGRWGCTATIPKGADPGLWSQTFTAVDTAGNVSQHTIAAYIVVTRNP